MTRSARAERYDSRRIFEPSLGRYVRVHVAVFLATAGPSPWPCAFCGNPVPELRLGVGLVHHADEDPTNDHPDNLWAAHWNCHSSDHLSGRPASPATVEAWRNLGRRSPTDATKQKLRQVNLVLTPVERQHARTLYAEGFLYQREIAALFGVSQGVIFRIMREEPVDRIKRCRRGHEMTKENTYLFADGPACKTCKREQSLASYHRSKTNKEVVI